MHLMGVRGRDGCGSTAALFGRIALSVLADFDRDLTVTLPTFMIRSLCMALVLVLSCAAVRCRTPSE